MFSGTQVHRILGSNSIVITCVRRQKAKRGMSTYVPEINVGNILVYGVLIYASSNTFFSISLYVEVTIWGPTILIFPLNPNTQL